MTKTAIIALFVLLALACHEADADRSQQADAAYNRLPDYKTTAPGSSGSQVASPELLGPRLKQLKVLNADARIFLYENFLSPEECDEIIKHAEPRLAPSVVVEEGSDNKKTLLTTSKIRTSSGMFFNRGENQVIRTVEERIAAWTLLPAGNGEGMQVLRYGNAEKYDAHWDYHFHEHGASNGGNRYATILAYLSDVEAGGETFFPFFPAAAGENAGLSECARPHMAVRPKKGDAILFHSIRPNGGFEKRSLHGSCPVIKGTKWAMVKWLHVGHYAEPGKETPLPMANLGPPPTNHTASDCKNAHAKCDKWSLDKECFFNPEWMIGTPDRPGHCLASCLRCDVWHAHIDLVKRAQQNNAAQGSKAGQVTGCKDQDERCPRWSLEGHCIQTADWMVGNATSPGQCLSSCLRCDIHQDSVSASAGQQASGGSKVKGVDVY